MIVTSILPANKPAQEKEKDNPEIHSLPKEVLLHILSFLPMTKLITASHVSRKWRKLCTEPSLWKQFPLNQRMQFTIAQQAPYEANYSHVDSNQNLVNPKTIVKIQERFVHILYENGDLVSMDFRNQANQKVLSLKDPTWVKMKKEIWASYSKNQKKIHLIDPNTRNMTTQIDVPFKLDQKQVSIAGKIIYCVADDKVWKCTLPENRFNKMWDQKDVSFFKTIGRYMILGLKHEKFEVWNLENTNRAYMEMEGIPTKAFLYRGQPRLIMRNHNNHMVINLDERKMTPAYTFLNPPSLPSYSGSEIRQIALEKENSSYVEYRKIVTMPTKIFSKVVEYSLRDGKTQSIVFETDGTPFHELSFFNAKKVERVGAFYIFHQLTGRHLDEKGISANSVWRLKDTKLHHECNLPDFLDSEYKNGVLAGIRDNCIEYYDLTIPLTGTPKKPKEKDGCVIS